MKKILIADDERAVRLLIGEELKDRGYEVSYAMNGREALQFFEAIPVDLVILDINMPEMDGLEALRQIKEQKPDIPVILDTAYIQYRNSFMSWAADYYFVKSSDLGGLMTAIEILLSGGILWYWSSLEGPLD